MTDTRTYIKVHDGMPDHPKIEGLSDKAFRLLVSTWCWSSRHRTDGRVPATVWAKRAPAKVRAELVAARLVEQHTDHVQVHDYLEHQRSAEQIATKVEKKRTGGAIGNHKRWHTNKPAPNCPYCIADASQPRSQVRQPEVGNKSNLRTANDRDDAEEKPAVSEDGIKPPHDTESDPDQHEPNRTPIAQPSQVRSQNRSQTDRAGSPEVRVGTTYLPDRGITDPQSDPVGALRGKGYEGQRARDEPPPPRCPQHLDEPTDGPCGPCGRARRTRADFDADQTRRAEQQRSADARRNAELRAAAALACTLCDPDGHVGNRVCDHDHDRVTRADRARAEARNTVRAALRKDPA